MAELVSVDGLRIRFDSKSVSAVADHDETGQPGTCVYGVTKTYQKIGESCDAFLTRLGIRPSFAKLTRVGGASMWINVGAVDFVRQALPTDVSSANSVISFGGAPQAIIQDFDSATATLNAICKKI